MLRPMDLRLGEPGGVWVQAGGPPSEWGPLEPLDSLQAVEDSKLWGVAQVSADDQGAVA